MNTYKANEYAEQKNNIKQTFYELYNNFSKIIDDDWKLREKEISQETCICSLEMQTVDK